MVTGAEVIVVATETEWIIVGGTIMMIMERIVPLAIGVQVEDCLPLETMTGAIDTILQEIVIEVLVIVTETVVMAIGIEVI